MVLDGLGFVGGFIAMFEVCTIVFLMVFNYLS